MKFLITIFITGISLNMYCQQNPIGNWRAIPYNEKQKKVEDSGPQTGDLVINQDSTFYIYGDSVNLKSGKVSGWVSGDEYRGKWNKPDNTHLNLNIEYTNSKETKMRMPFSIVEMTKEKLVLRLLFLKKKSKFPDLSYRRI